MRASAPSSSSSSSPPPQDPTRVFFRRRRRRRSKKKKKKRNRYKIPKQRGCFLFKVCREKQKKKKRDPPTMCLFSSFFLSRDFFIGRPWNTCFFSLARERERDSKNFFPFFFVEISLSFFLSFPQSFQLSKCHQVFLIICIHNKTEKKSTPHTRKKKRKKETQQHRPPHPKRIIQSVSQKSRRQRRRRRQREETTETKREKERRVFL